MAGVEIRNLTKVYSVGGEAFAALHDINCTICDASLTVVVGKSGCGKTTLLRLMGGLEEKSGGDIQFTYHDPAVKNRRIGLVFQEPRLLPWLTVKQNMAFSLQGRLEIELIEARVKKYLCLLGLENFQTAYPRQLSGGMAQRVAIGRTLCYDPDLILMDEPFSSLDYFTRKRLQGEIIDLFLAQQKTIVFVTHDVTEAALLGQKVMIMAEGNVIREIPIPLPYHRDIRTLEFLEVQNQILAALSGE